MEKALERKRICSAVFLDISQAFDRVWYKGLLHKLRSILPYQFFLLLKSYLTDRKFRIRQEDVCSKLKDICVGVPQGSVLGPVLYLLYINDIPETYNTSIATFADDTALLAVGNTLEESKGRLQQAVNNVATWTKKWRIKLNESKSTYINFTNKRIDNVPISINGVCLQPANTAKYLGMNLDVKLRWSEHVKKKVEELNIKHRKMYLLLGRHSELATESKLLLYKQVLRPVWTYGIQLWGCSKKTHTEKIQRFQNKVLRSIVNAPKYVRVTDLHRDLGVEMVTDMVPKHANSHKGRLEQHINEEASRLLMSRFTFRRLKRSKPFELSTSPHN
uniref:Reverse transcriptase domain-containing protein n=1 Tax=Clastoptera arizonana TaxID=38151 RepID=A0A1B6DFT6_9HEMI